MIIGLFLDYFVILLRKGQNNIFKSPFFSNPITHSTMKKIFILAALVTCASAAHAQGNQTVPVKPTIRTASDPSFSTNEKKPNNNNGFATKGKYLTSESDYTNVSQVEQSGTGNYADVQQTAGSSAFKGTDGNSAYLEQTGKNNDAYQKQVSAAEGEGESHAEKRNFESIKQYGQKSYASQDQHDGTSNTANITQGRKSTQNNPNTYSDNLATNNSATQTQTGEAGQLTINQGVTGGPAKGNTAVQTQGGEENKGVIAQDGTSNYAKQTQDGEANEAWIAQEGNGTGKGAYKNTALQDQTGYNNKAFIYQKNPASGNYAEQNQHGNYDKAYIEQNGTDSYARQDQNGSGSSTTGNYSDIQQHNSANAAYTNQSGTSNQAFVKQQ